MRRWDGSNRSLSKHYAVELTPRTHSRRADPSSKLRQSHSWARFHTEFMRRLRRLDIDVHIWTMPSEIENAVPFDQDRTRAQYDPQYASRFHQALVQAARVMKEFRAHFIGKVS